MNTVIDDRSYRYDRNSNILDIATNVEQNAYAYDRLDRVITDAIDSNSPIDFQYDLNDNRLTKTSQDLALQELFEHLTGSNRIKVREARQSGLTPITTPPSRNLVYNDVGRLFQLIEEGIKKAEYLYNDEGQRTRKTVYQADGVSIDSITIYHYDHMGYLITETTETGTLIKDYIWTEGMHPVAQIDNNGGIESIIYLYTDHLMTNRLATDENQLVVWRWEGEAFGNTLAEEISGVKVNLRFPGQYFDGETGLHYNHYRYYDPALGRYITSDPIGIDGGANTYTYVSANPTNRYDYFGLFDPADYYQVCNCPNITAKRDDINKNPDEPWWSPSKADDWGHYWTEINGKESYGWWPNNQVASPWDAVTGVGGSLNGIGGNTFSGGSATRDPHHGFPATSSFHPSTAGSHKKSCREICDEAADCFRTYAKEQSKSNDSWRYPGNSCQDFQEEGFKRCGLRE